MKITVTCLRDAVALTLKRFANQACKGTRQIRTRREAYRLYASEPSEVSVVMPMHNRSGRVVEVLNALVSSLVLSAELIIVDDASRDGTLREVLDWLDVLPCNTTTIHSVIVLRNRWACFETYCDAIGFDIATSPYLIEVQADMVIADTGFDQRLVCSLRANPDLVAISGRGVHRLSDVWRFRWDPWVFGRPPERILSHLDRVRSRAKSGRPELHRCTDVTPNAKTFSVFGNAGRLGVQIEVQQHFSSEDKHTVWVGETVMRGPLVLDRAKFARVGGFDTRRFFLGNDDHDFSARASLIGYRVAFSPVEFTSQLSDGTSRQNRTMWTRVRIAGLLIRQRILFKSSGLSKLRRNNTCLAAPEVRTVTSSN
jgi:glycosyltransferase involved in cell wall biosynthesis